MEDFGGEVPDRYAERVVVFRYDKIGDLIVTSSLFKAIKTGRPGAHVTLVASEYNRGVLEGMPEIDRILVYDRNFPLARKLKFALALRAWRPTAVFVMSPGFDGYLLARLSGAKARAGMVVSHRRLSRLVAPLLLDTVESVDLPRLNEGADRRFHQSEIGLRLAERLGYDRPRDVSHFIPVDAETLRWAWTCFPLSGGGAAPRILLHLGISWNRCGLDPSDIADLVERLHARFPRAVLLLTAGPADEAMLETVESRSMEAVRDGVPALRSTPSFGERVLLCTDLSFRQWSALIATASLVVAPDTGAVHLASAHGVPVVVVYAPKSFNRNLSMFGPWEVPFRALSGEAGAGLGGQIIAAAAELLIPAGH